MQGNLNFVEERIVNKKLYSESLHLIWELSLADSPVHARIQ